MTVRGFKIDATTGDLSFTAAKRLEMVSDTEAIAQAQRAEIRFIKGEWRFDTSKGVDYNGVVLVKNPRFAAVQREFQNAILNTPGTTGIASFEFELDPETRAYSATYEATTDTGELIAQTVES